MERAAHHEGLVAADLAARDRMQRDNKPNAPVDPSLSPRGSSRISDSSSSSSGSRTSTTIQILGSHLNATCTAKHTNVRTN